MAAQHPPHAHPCLDCCPTPSQHIPMSPLVPNTHPIHTHVSIAAQQPQASTIVSIAAQQPRAGTIAAQQPRASTIVSVAAQQPRAMATHQGHCCAFPGRGLSTSSTQNFRKCVPLQRCRGRRGSLIVICTTKQEPQDDDNKDKDNNNPVPRGSITPLGPPHSDKTNP